MTLEEIGLRVSAEKAATTARGETFYPGASRVHLAAFPPKERWDDWVELDSRRVEPQLRQGAGHAQPGDRSGSDPGSAQACRRTRRGPLEAGELGRGAGRHRRPYPDGDCRGPTEREHVPRRAPRREDRYSQTDNKESKGIAQKHGTINRAYVVG